MKRIVLTVSALFAFMVMNAQNVTTTNWPNGNKKSEGIVIGDTKLAAGTSKEEQEKNAASIIKDGKWTTWFENGSIRSEEFYKNGVMVGEWKFLHENGNTESLINFETGKAIHYTNKGTVSSEGAVAKGMISVGEWTGYYENGAKNYKGSYNMEGQKDGVWTWWDEKGNVSAEQTFKNGVLIKK
jgi:antitoxin component YwqK of YwqJK toxin-antitoxin module